MTVEIISWSNSTKVWDQPGLNSRPLDLRSDSLLTALWGPVSHQKHGWRHKYQALLAWKIKKKITFFVCGSSDWTFKGLDKQNCKHFLTHHFNICFGCSKETSHWSCSFEFPQHMFWLRNKKTIFGTHS